MGVYLHENGNWYCRGRIDGERYHLPCTGAKDIKQAKAIEDGIRYNIRLKQQGLLKEPDKTYTLRFMMDMYIADTKAKNKSWKDSERQANNIVKYFGAKRDIKDIKPFSIEEYMRKIVDNGRTKSTANRYLSSIKRAYNIMITNELIDYNPTNKVKKYIEDNRRYRFLSKEEWIRLQEVMKPHLKEIVTTALCTGLRLNNVLKLHWDYINLEKKYIEILKQDNKGKKNIKIPINKCLFDILNSHSNKTGYVFVNPDTNKPYTSIKRTFNTALKEANIKDFHFHDLRRTFGTWLKDKGVDIRTIQELLAHSDISTTERYLSLTKESTIKAVDIIDSFM